jgi:predicted transposase/invertase (TIGR01784 family)
MDKKPLSPKNDYVFKKIFGENLPVLTDFLKAVLDLPEDEYQGLEVLDPTLRAENLGDKYCILDIRLHTKSKDIIDIEIQVKYQEFIWKRIQFYTSKMLVEQAKSGDRYEILPHVITILITDFVLIKENGIFHNRFRLYDEKTKARFPDSMEINVLEIPKVSEGDGSQLSNWVRFFAATTEEDFMALAQTSPAIAEAWGVIKHLSADESTRMIAESREKARMDMEAYRETGRREGLREVARNLLQEKLPVELVVKSTGLSIEEVNLLASDIVPGLTHLNFECHQKEVCTQGCLEAFGLHAQFAGNV